MILKKFVKTVVMMLIGKTTGSNLGQVSSVG